MVLAKIAISARYVDGEVVVTDKAREIDRVKKNDRRTFELL